MLTQEERDAARIQRRYDKVINQWRLGSPEHPQEPPKPPPRARAKRERQRNYQRKIDDAVFAQMVAAGSTPKQIAIDLGVSRQAVSQCAARLGLREALRANRPKPKPRKRKPRTERYGLPLEVVEPLIKRGVLQAFRVQRNNAKKRGIGWELSFAQWWAIWEPHYDRRGRGKDCLVMCRTGDKGPYAVGNVRLASPKENRQEAVLERMSRTGRKMRSRQFVQIVPGSILSRSGVFREYAEDGETA